MKIRNTLVIFTALSFLYIFGALRINNISPELLLVFICVYSKASKISVLSIVLSMLSSFIMCTFGGRSFLFTFTFILVFAVICIGNFKSHFMVLLTFVLYESLYYLIFYYKVVNPWDAVLNVVLPSAMLNSGIYFIAYKIFKSLKRGHLLCKISD